MEKIIGQENLLFQIKSFSIDTLPKTMLLYGKRGNGKHMVAKFIATYFKLELKDITKDISFDYLLELSKSPILTLYLINLDEIEERQQGAILKFIEEPIDSAFILSLSSSYNILETIKNRCFKFELEPYKRPELLNFNSNEQIIDHYSFLSVGALKSLTGEVLENINKAIIYIDNFKNMSLSKALLLENKFNYKDSYSKIDIDLFLTIYQERLKENLKKEFTLAKEKVYLETNKVYNMLSNQKVNKEPLIENYLINVWVIYGTN